MTLQVECQKRNYIIRQNCAKKQVYFMSYYICVINNQSANLQSHNLLIFSFKVGNEHNVSHLILQNKILRLILQP